MGVLEFLGAVFSSIIEVAKLGTALAPTDKMKEERQTMKKPLLTSGDFNKEFVRLRTHLLFFPKQKIDTLVDLRCDGYDADDIQNLKNSLYEIFPKKRWHAEVKE